MTHDVELVIDDPGVGSMTQCCLAKGLPHVHDGYLDGPAALGPHGVEEPFQILFRASLSVQPDGSSLIQVGDHNGVGVALPNGDLINADGPKLFGRRMLFQQSAHVAFLHAPYLIPAQVIQLRNALDRHLAAELPDAVLEPLGEPGRPGQHGERLALHGSAMRAGNPAILERKIDATGSGIQIPHPMRAAIPISERRCPAAGTDRFF